MSIKRNRKELDEVEVKEASSLSKPDDETQHCSGTSQLRGRDFDICDLKTSMFVITDLRLAISTF